MHAAALRWAPGADFGWDRMKSAQSVVRAPAWKTRLLESPSPAPVPLWLRGMRMQGAWCVREPCRRRLKGNNVTSKRLSAWA